MTLKNGVLLGAIIGLFAHQWLKTSTDIQLVNFGNFSAWIIGGIAIIILFLSSAWSHSVFDTTIDGFIYGFSGAFDGLNYLSGVTTA